MLGMFGMSGEHAADDHVLFGPVEQFRQGLSDMRSHGGHDAERDGWQGGDGACLRDRGQFADHGVAEPVGHLSAGDRHHGVRVAMPLHRGDQRVKREPGLAAAGCPRNQCRVIEIVHIHHVSPA